MHIDRRYACGLLLLYYGVSLLQKMDTHLFDDMDHTILNSKPFRTTLLSPHLPGIEVKAIDGGFDTALKVVDMVFP